jgi:hypothetical protein
MHSRFQGFTQPLDQGMHRRRPHEKGTAHP